MAEVVAVVGIVIFVLFMIFFHNVYTWCVPPSTAITATTEATSDEMTVATPAADLETANGQLDVLTTPTGVYAIGVEDEPDNGLTAVRATRVVSFIRFSGYTDSEGSISERSTGLSFWSAVDANQKESETSAATQVESPSAEAEVKPRQWKRHARLPYLDGCDDDDDVDGVYHVEIGMMKGFAQKNLLSFKPYKPRALKTKHINKHNLYATRPPHIFVV